MNRYLIFYILGILSAFTLTQILSYVDETRVIKVPQNFNRTTINDNLVGYFDKDSIFHLIVLDTSLIKFRWNDIEAKIPCDKALIQIEYREENTLYLRPININ